MISKSPFLVTRQVSPKLSLLLRQGYWAADCNKIFGKIPTQTPYLSHSVVEFATFNRLSLCRVSGFACFEIPCPCRYHLPMERRSGVHSMSSLSRNSFRGGSRHGGGRGQRSSSGSVDERINSLGRLLTKILRHMASELNLNIRRDGYVKVNDLLQLNITTHAKVPLKSHTLDEIKEAVRKDSKQRFNLIEENGMFLIRANQGHSIESLSSDSLLRPILSAADAPVCVHGTYKQNLELILQSGLKRMQRLHVHFANCLPTDGEVISGFRSSVNILIFLDVGKALEDGMKMYISSNNVILTEGFDGVVPVKYFQKIETWPGRQVVPF